MDTASIPFIVFNTHLESLRELVAAFPGLRLVAKGWGYSDCIVSGPADLVEAFRPRLEAWQRECDSVDAW